MVRREEHTEARNFESFDHNKNSFFTYFYIQFYKVILYKKNLLEEIHSSDKYPIKDEQGPSRSWQEYVTDCNKSKFIVIISYFMFFKHTLQMLVVMNSKFCESSAYNMPLRMCAI
jgi:hypothetical protein